MAFDVQTLNDAARCAECLSPNQKQNVLLYLLNGILLNGASGGGVHDLLSASHPDTLPAAVLRGSLIVGDSTPLWSELVIGASGTVLRSNGTDATWSQLALTTDVTGILPIANGGTNSSAALNNNRIMVSSAGAIVEAAALTNGQLLIGSTGAAPVAASLIAGANISITPGAGSITIASTVGTHTILDATVHTDSVTQAVTRGSLIYGNSTPKWDELAIGAAGTFLGSDGTDAAWTSLPGSFTGFANPTALVGLAAVNGVATTAMRSDGAPALDQSIVPTWTGAHTWTPPANTAPITVSGYSLTGANAQSVLDLSGTWNTSGTPTAIKLNITNTASSASSLLLDLQRDSISRFRVLRTGYGVLTRQEADISSGGLSLQKRGTTGDATAAISNASNITAFSFEGWDGSVYVQGAVVKTVATEVWTGSAHGTKMVFGVAAIGGSTAVTLMELTSTALTLSPYGASAGNTSEIRFLELAASGTNYTGFKAADAMAASEIYVLPNAAPSANRFLQAAAVAGGVSALSWAQVSLTADVTGILPVANGGSGTSTAFTAGSVIFAGPAGVYSEDNANFFYTDATNRLTVNQLNLPVTTSATVGGIYFGSSRAFHNFGTENTFAGVGSGNFTMTGASNSAFGFSILSVNTSGANNCAFGKESLRDNTTGSNNSAFGTSALALNTTGAGNSAFGLFSLLLNTTGGNNTAVGKDALQSNTIGTDNAALGIAALLSNTSGITNSAFGANALRANITGTGNLAFGYNALLLNTSGMKNTAIGESAMGAVTTGSNNISLGVQSADNLTTGSNNITIGHNIDSPTAVNSNTLNIGNLIFGTVIDGTGVVLSTGNIGIGVITPLAKLHVTNSAAATVATIIKAAAAQSANLTEWQSSAAVANTVINAAGNISIPTTTATVGIIFQDSTRLIHTFGTNNYFAGAGAGNFTLSGIDNTGVGAITLASLTSGAHNVAVGRVALNGNTTGSFNTAVGRSALSSNTTGGQNIANGYFALTANTTGSFNVANGYRALFSNVDGTNNQANGYESLFLNVSGMSNTATGTNSLHDCTGSNNIATGLGAGANITTGSNNIVIGFNVSSPTATNSNTLVIGNLLFGTGIDGTGVVLSSGNIGIGVITPLAKLHVTNSAAATVATIIKAAAAQSANLTEWQSSAAVANTVINAAGNISIPATTSTTGIIFLGTERLIHAYGGVSNIFIGTLAGNFTTTSSMSVAVGRGSLGALTSGSNNTGIGPNTLKLTTTGFSNMAIGESALTANTIGSGNLAIGVNAMLANIDGVNNVAIGTNSLRTNTAGDVNVGIGNNALYTTTGDFNSAIGGDALRFLTTGSNNIAIGWQAGNNLTTGSANIIIGYDIDSPTAANSNTLTLGNLLFGSGLDGTGTALSSGGIGIRVITPTAYLHICAGTTAASTAPIKLTSGPLLTVPEVGAIGFLTDDLFFTITTGTARKRLLMADATAGLTSGKIPIATTNGRLIDLTASAAYTPTNVTTDRSYDANATTLDELSDVVGTMIADLQTKGILG